MVSDVWKVHAHTQRSYFVIAAASYDLSTHVVQSANAPAQGIPRQQAPRTAEVAEQPFIAVLLVQNVGRLDVQVHDAVAVQEVESQQDVDGNLPNLLVGYLCAVVPVDFNVVQQ